MNTLPIPINQSLAWSPVLTAYLQTLSSEQTKRAYGKAIKAAMQQLGDLATLQATQLTAYRDQWVSRLEDTAAQPLSAASISLHLSALRSFLKFARLTGQVPLSNEIIQFCLKSPKVTVVNPYEVPNDREFNQLVVAARAQPRDRMILTLAGATGLREAELCNLKLGDIHTDDENDLVIKVRMGKGRKDRLIPVDTETAALLRSYLHWRKLDLVADAKEYLFASRKGKGKGRLSTGRVRQLIGIYRLRAHILKPISMHGLRHRFGIERLRATGNIIAVQEMMGHANLSTTQKYLHHLHLKELKAVVNAKKRQK